ncbi:hypothetical protein HK104_001127 [Borealophlyctis nickersoniae]|nr:hypothetical protein HK104_001127 [Borealophlyctis nickersoniae]
MSGNNFTLHTCETNPNQVIAKLKDLHMFERKVATELKNLQHMMERKVIAELKDLLTFEREVATQLKNLHHTTERKCIRMSNYLAGRLDTVDFSFGNMALDETILKEFVQNADTFQWFNERFPKIAESMQRGLDDRTRSRLEVEEEEMKESIEKLLRNEMEEEWNEIEKEWNDIEKEWNDIQPSNPKEWNHIEKKWNDIQHSNPTVANTGSRVPTIQKRPNPTVANTGSRVPTIQKRPNPTVANEKSNKKPKNAKSELDRMFDQLMKER